MNERLTRRALLGSAAIGVGAWGATEAVQDRSAVNGAVRMSPTIGQGELDQIAVVAAAERFPGVDPTGNADSSAGLQAAINATPDGGSLVVPAGRYAVSTALFPKLGRSITIVGYGAVLVQSSSKPVVSLTGTYSPALSVTALSTSTTTGYGPQTKLTLASAPGWTPGDVIKVVSDDVIPEGRPGPGDGAESRLGEFAVVQRVNGRTVYLNGLLREDYRANVRSCLTSSQSIRLVGLAFDVAATRIGLTNGPLIYLSKLRGPEIRDVKIRRAEGVALQLASCIAYVVSNMGVDYAADNSSNGQYGYGVLDNACAHGTVIGGVFRHVRHAYTDDTPRVQANSDPGGYGRTFDTLVSGVSAVMTTNTAFDTHHCSLAVTFAQCSATGGRSQGEGQYGFQLRGRDHRVVNCSVMSTEGGVQVMTEQSGGQSRGHLVTDLVVSNTAGPALRTSIRQPGHPDAGKRDVRTLDVHDIIAENTGPLLISANADVRISGALYAASAGSAGTNVHGIYAENSLVELNDSRLDFTSNSAGTPRVIASGEIPGSQPGTQETSLSEVVVKANSDVVARTWAPISGPLHLVRARGLRFTYPFAMMPGEGLAEGSQVQWTCDEVSEVDSDWLSSAVHLFGNSTLPATLDRLNRSPDPILYLRGSSTVVLVSPALPTGAWAGQRLTIHYTDSRTLTIRHGSAFRTSLSQKADRVLTPDETLHLLWTGSVWREVPP